MSDRIAGMFITKNTVAIEVLAREGKRWRMDEMHICASLSEMRARGTLQQYRGVPVVLDAAAFTIGMMNALEIPVIDLRAAGLDVRPPRWRNGKAANPSGTELRQNWLDVMGRTATGDPSATEELAAWGATHETTAEPPPPDRSERILPPSDERALDAAYPWALITEAIRALRDRAERHLDDYDRRLTLARNALREAGVPEVVDDRALDVAERIAMLATQRDDAEAALLKLRRVTGDQGNTYPICACPAGECVPTCEWASARALLARRGMTKSP